MSLRISARLDRMLATSTNKALLAIFSGTAAAQLVLMTSTPLLTRLYSPGEFGTYASMLSVALIISGVAGLRYEWALPLPDSDPEARALVGLYGFSVAATAVVVVAVCAVLAMTDHSVFGVHFPTAWVLAPLVVSLSAFTLANQVALRGQRYASMGGRNLLQALVTVAAQLLFALSRLGAAGLAAGVVLGRCVAAIRLLWADRALLDQRGASEHRAVARRYKRFPLLFMPSSLLNLVGTHLPILAVSLIYGVAATGNIGLAIQVLSVPAALLAAALGQVYAGELAARLRAGHVDNRRQYLRISGLLAVPAVAVTAASLTLSPQLFPWAFGPSWAAAGDMARAMSLSIGLGVVASPLSFVFVAYERGALSIFVDASRVVLILAGAVGALSLSSGPVALCWGMYAGQALNYAITWLLGLRLATHSLDGSATSQVSCEETR